MGVAVPNVFISYSRRDRERVIQLADALQGEGLSVWWDPNLVPGRKFRQMIAEQLAAADCVVVVWTAASLESDWVQDEAEEARVRGVLIPVMMDPVKAPAGFRQVQAADLSQWTGNRQHPEFRALVQAAQTLAQMARAVAPTPSPSPLPGEILAAADVALRPGDTPAGKREEPVAAAPIAPEAEPEPEAETIELPPAPAPPPAPPPKPSPPSEDDRPAPIPPPFNGPTGLVGLCVRIFDAPTHRRVLIAMIAVTAADLLATVLIGLNIVVPIVAGVTVPLGAWVARACLRAGVGPVWKVVTVAWTLLNLLLALLVNPSPLGFLRTVLSAPGTLCGSILVIGLIALAAHRFKQRRKARAGLP